MARGEVALVLYDDAGRETNVEHRDTVAGLVDLIVSPKIKDALKARMVDDRAT